MSLQNKTKDTGGQLCVCITHMQTKDSLSLQSVANFGGYEYRTRLSCYDYRCTLENSLCTEGDVDYV